MNEDYQKTHELDSSGVKVPISKEQVDVRVNEACKMITALLQTLEDPTARNDTLKAFLEKATQKLRDTTGHEKRYFYNTDDSEINDDTIADAAVVNAKVNTCIKQLEDSNDYQKWLKKWKEGELETKEEAKAEQDVKRLVETTMRDTTTPV